jgi:hypothetical protein
MQLHVGLDSDCMELMPGNAEGFDSGALALLGGLTL